jgi:hypothetical protein
MDGARQLGGVPLTERGIFPAEPGVGVITRTHPPDSCRHILRIGRDTKGLEDEHAFFRTFSRGAKIELAGVQMYFREAEAVNELFDRLGFPVKTSAGLLEAHNTPRLHACLGNVDDAGQHPKEHVYLRGYLESRSLSFSPIEGAEAASACAR